MILHHRVLPFSLPITFYRRMIERMLFYGRKAELQCLLQGPEGAVGLGWYLQRKLRLTQPLNEVSL